MSFPNHQAPAAAQIAAARATTPHGQARIMKFVEPSYLMYLPNDVEFMIIEKMPDDQSIGAPHMSCKTMYAVIGADEQSTRMLRDVLLAHGGRGFIGLTQAIATVTMPTVDRQVLLSADKLIKAIRVAWGKNPGTTNRGDHEANLYVSMKRSLGQSLDEGPATEKDDPLPDFTWELKLMRRAPRDDHLWGPRRRRTGATVPLPGHDTPVPRGIPAWRSGQTIATLTLAQARQLAEVGQYVWKFSLYYNSHCREPEMGADSHNALWLFETFCQVLGGDYWWKRWRPSRHFLPIVEAFQKAAKQEDEPRHTYRRWFPTTWEVDSHPTYHPRLATIQEEEDNSSEYHDKLHTVHDFLTGLVWCKLRRLTLEGTASTTVCKCALPRLFRDCRRCQHLCVEGALSMGLAAVWRIVEADVDDLEEVQRCFTWEGDLPRQHPYFLHFFFNRTTLYGP